jgi:EmrB/QacA subfamily drug resistance transporter
MAGVNVALPSIGKEFSLNAVLLAWIVTVIVLATGVALVPAGRIADIYGRRKIFIYSSVLMFIGYLTAALAPNITILMVARVLQGIGAGMSSATYMAILISVYPASERGKVLGINVAAVYIGLSTAPVIGGFLTQSLGWRSIFYICAGIALIIIIASIWKIKGEWAEAKGEKFDTLGSVLLGIGMIAVIYGVTLLPTLPGILIFIAGLVMLGLFVFWELRTKSPVINLNLFRHNRVFAFSNVATLLNYMATSCVSFLLVLYLQYIKGFKPFEAGLILLVQPVLMAIVAPLAGRLSDEVKPQLVFTAGMVLTTAGLVMFAFLDNDTPIIYVIISQVVIGIGFGAFASPNTNAIVSSVDKKYYGVSSAVIGTMRTVGQMLSQGMITLLFALFIGHESITPVYYPAFLHSTQIIFIISAVFCFAGIFASLYSTRNGVNKK